MSGKGATMSAVVIKGPYQIVTEQRPIPRISSPDEVVCKVELSALCGSDLHLLRGHSPTPKWDFIMGHEFVGTISELGADVKNFKVGDKVVAPFTASCGNCFFCDRGWTCRCTKSKLFGSYLLEGGQAEYVKVPLADSTLFEAPSDVPNDHLILMCDIFPTGYFATKNAWNMLNDIERQNSTVAVIGCGPVGLCGITAAAQKFSKVFAIDSIPERLAQAKTHGAIPVELSKDPISVIKAQTDGRGPDAVLEIVGAPDALLLAIDLVRVGGVIASCGLHTHEIPVDGLKLYNKNIRLQFGRCPARHLFPESLEVLRKVSKESPNVWDAFIQKRVKLSDAAEYYELFDKRKVGKTVFV